MFGCSYEYDIISNDLKFKPLYRIKIMYIIVIEVIKMDRTKKFREVKKYAKQLGFDVVAYTGDTFSAENRNTRVSVYAYTQYGSKYTVDISWSSAGIPRPTNTEVKKVIKMLQNALKLKEKLK